MSDESIESTKDRENEEWRKRIEAAVSALGEHCESIRIFCTKPGVDDAGDANFFSTGRGNFFTQIGYLKEWIIGMEEITRDEAREKLRRERE